MGNSLTSAVGISTSATTTATRRTTSSTQRNRNEHYRHSHPQTHAYPHAHTHEQRSKTLPARHQPTQRVNSHPNSCSPVPPPSAPPPNGETSRMLFLLYLIHRTWNVVVDTVDTRSKRSRHSAPSEDSGAPPTNSFFEDSQSCCDVGGNFSSVTITDLDDDGGDQVERCSSSFCDSQNSCCSCSYCFNATQNVYNSIGEGCSTDSIYGHTMSACESDLSSFYNGYQMAPSICRNSPTLTPANKATSASAAASIAQKSQSQSQCGSGSLNGSVTSYKMTNSENSWPQSIFSKENQRPPVYNPEDYAQSLKKFGKRQTGSNARSIYDTTTEETYRCSTLPSKHNEYKSPIPAPLESESEMSLRQFASITDLLTKLRADLRVSFPSFVQEFIATPSDGVSLLLEVLRAIQLSQSTNCPLPTAQMTGSMPRNAQTYQRRALLDELACLQCLSICCSRSLEANARLGTTPVGLMPLASSATGQGIRARILAMQLMSAACDKHVLGHGSQKIVNAGHTAVSEAMSTLRLRCSEPVRFRLLIGMLNSGGGSGELQAVGVKFINTFLESSENLQQRLYLQAELFQAGFEPTTLAKTISSSSPWLDTLRSEIRRFHELHIDVEKMLTQARDADRVRSQMVILERRVQILHEEKAVLTSMERRLQERCAELQREIFRLQGAHNDRDNNKFKSLDKQQPIALPRHVPPTHGSSGKQSSSSEHEDEGISSSETGPSLSPVPILVLPQSQSAAMSSTASASQKKYNKTKRGGQERVGQERGGLERGGQERVGHERGAHVKDDPNGDDATTIEDVMEELDNIVSEAEREISSSSLQQQQVVKEKDIVPVNIVPQPPRKSRSLAHLLSQDGGGSELDGSEYGMLLMQNQADQAVERVTGLQTFFDETDYEATAMMDEKLPNHASSSYAIESHDIPEMGGAAAAAAAGYQPSTTRQLLDVIMNARHSDDDPTIKAFREGGVGAPSSPQLPPAAIAAGGVIVATHATPPPPTHPRQHSKRNSYASGDSGAAATSTSASKRPQAPAQHFNGVFFMTGMNTPQRYPKPDVSAALQARRVTKNVERLEAAFATTTAHETVNEELASPSRDKSRSNQQIYFGSNPTLRINTSYGSYTNNVTVINSVTTRTRSYTQGSKVTDIPSGLY